jgi:hypothetical protein
MHIQWCLKGIREQVLFGDKEAAAVVDEGIQSKWLFNNGTMPVVQAISAVQSLLSETNLIMHVNNYSAVSATTPYISLCSASAGNGESVCPLR